MTISQHHAIRSCGLLSHIFGPISLMQKSWFTILNARNGLVDLVRKAFVCLDLEQKSLLRLWSLNKIFLFHRAFFCSRPEFNGRPMLHRLTSSGYSPNSDHGELEPCEEMARRSETRSWTHMSKHNSRRLHWSCTVLYACYCSQQKTALKSCWSKMGLYVKSLWHGKALFKDSFGSQTQGLQT